MEVAPEYKIEWTRALRRRQTQSEELLWRLIRGGKLDGLKFRRQHPIDRFIADFCCESHKLVIEIDGGYHDTPQQRELNTERAAYFTGRGYRILRFSNETVFTDFRTVLRQITAAATEHKNAASEAEDANATGTPLPPRSGNKGRGEGGEGNSDAGGEGNSDAGGEDKQKPPPNGRRLFIALLMA